MNGWGIGIWAGIIGATVGIFLLGWSARIFCVERRDDKKLRAAEARYERHHHRKGDPLPAGLVELPHSGRLAVEPEPWPELEPITVTVRQLDPEAWRFSGESEQGWAAETAEYELLHQPRVDYHNTCPRCASCGQHRHGGECSQPESEPDPRPELTDTGEMRALSDAWIAKMQGDNNEWIWGHLMRTSE